jgi:hypothetical protein
MTTRGRDYVLVSTEDEDLEIYIPSNVDPRAFLEEVPWHIAARHVAPRALGNPWKRARLYLQGKLIDEFFFIADDWPTTQKRLDGRQTA